MAVKRIVDLTTEELTTELKKRKLDVTGDRNVLITRLRKALAEEKKKKPQAAVKVEASSSSQTKKSDPASTPLAVNETATVPCSKSESERPSASVAQLGNVSTEPGRDELMECQVQAGESKTSPVLLGKEIDKSPLPSKGVAAEVVATATEKLVDDPPLVLMVDESQNDLDDDIVCVSVTPGSGVVRVKLPSGGKSVSVERTTQVQPVSASSPEKKSSAQGDGKSDLSLWVSGLTSSCRAADLKTLFSTRGKVTGAKVVASAKSADSKWFGIVMMASPEDVERCIKELNGAELLGKMIAVESYSKRRSVIEKEPTTTATPTLWVKGLAQRAKAADLKKLFLAHGQVIASTIVTSAKSGTSKRFGLIKMSSCEEADVCIQKLNNTKLLGNTIVVERAKGNTIPQTTSPVKPSVTKPSTSEKPASLPTAAPAARASVVVKRKEPNIPRRGGGGPGRQRGGKAYSNMPAGRFGRRPNMTVAQRPNLTVAQRIKIERERRIMMRKIEHEQQLKARQAEVISAFAMEYDNVRRNQEEADRIAYEREQIQIEKLQLERQRVEAERMRLQLEQERREHEREQLERERERARKQMFREEQYFAEKRSADQDEAYWEYLMKRRRESGSPAPMSGNQSLGSLRPGSISNPFDNTTERLQQIATGSDRRLSESRLKDTISGVSSHQMTNKSSPHSSGYRPMMGGDDNSKSEWKSLFSMSARPSSGSGNSQSQWKAPASHGSVGGSTFPSPSSYRDRPYATDNSSGGGGSTFGNKSQYSGFKGVGMRGGHQGGGQKWH